MGGPDTLPVGVVTSVETWGGGPDASLFIGLGLIRAAMDLPYKILNLCVDSWSIDKTNTITWYTCSSRLCKKPKKTLRENNISIYEKYQLTLNVLTSSRMYWKALRASSSEPNETYHNWLFAYSVHTGVGHFGLLNNACKLSKEELHFRSHWKYWDTSALCFMSHLPQLLPLSCRRQFLLISQYIESDWAELLSLRRQPEHLVILER